MSKWQDTELGSLVTYKKGFAFKSDTYDENADVLIVRVSDTTESSINISSCKKISSALASTLSDYALKTNDVIIATVGSWADNPNSVVGKVIKVPSTASGALLNQNAVRLRCLDNLASQNFFYYCLKDNEFSGFLLGNAQGSANQASITLKDIFSYQISLPPLEEQKAIASVLSSLDDKIYLLHRQNTTLERMAETLFRQWFVEEAQEDWEETTIAELVEFNPPRKLIKGQIAPYLDMAGLDTSTFSPSGWYLREFSSGTKFINNDTLLARITPCLENGKTGYVTFLSETEIGWGSTEFIVMRPKLGIHPIFAYVLARYQDFRDYAEGCMEGSSGRQRVNVDHLKEYQMRMPSNEIIKRFNEAVSAITPKLELNAKQIKTLEKLRDNLLPKLMSGEVRVI